jgi:hypothetical protein
MLYWRGQWHDWDRGAYRGLDPDEHRARVTAFVKHEMNKAYLWQVRQQQEEEDHGAKEAVGGAAGHHHAGA